MELSKLPFKEVRALRRMQADGMDQHPVLYNYPEPLPSDNGQTPAYANLFDYWHLLVRRKITLLVFVAAGLGVAILVNLLQTPAYQARTSVQIQDFNEDFLDLGSVDPTSTGNYYTAYSYFQTQIKMLQSESLLERVINKLDLQNQQPENRSGLGARTRGMIGASTPQPVTRKDGLIQRAKSNLTVRAAGETRLLEVLYESADPKLAADFANTLVSEFIEQNQEMRWKSTRRTGEWLATHLDGMKAKLERSEAQLQEYARTSGLTFTSENKKISDVKLQELQAELSKAEADRVAKEANFEEAKNKPSESLPETLDDPALREYRLRLTDLQRQAAELSATLTPAHYKVRRVQAQIAQLQSALSRQRRLILRRIGNEYAAARRREALLSTAYSEQEKIVAEQSGKAIRYDTLKREVDSSRAIYESMLQRVKQAELASAMRVSNVLVVDQAKPPLLPHRPRVLMNMALGLFSGLFLGLGFILLRERLDRRIQAPGDAQSYLNLPELGVIPLAERPPREISGNHTRNPLQLPAPADADADAAAKSPELAMCSAKLSPLAEGIRGTLTSILFTGQNGTHPRVVVVTSPTQGDGKTTVASNLSIALAEMGRRVLLIDGDLRRPRLHRVFEVSNTHGLSDILSGDTPLDEVVSFVRVAFETKIPGLHLLPSGATVISSMNLFYSTRMAELLSRMRDEFEMVMIDAPPMILADARVLGRMADGVVLGMRAGQTTPEGASFISQRFVEDGTRVLGTVLNGWDPATRGYGYYGYKNSYGKYGYGEKRA